MNFSDFKTSPVMLALALGVVVFVIIQSLFFLIKAWKQGKKLGISTATLKNTVVSSALFTVAPAISILTTVIVLANALGLVLPWIRLTVIGNLTYETTAAQAALDFWGGSLTNAVTDPQQFATIAWAMTIGCVTPLILLPFLCKKLQKKIGNAVNKSESAAKLGDAISAAAFIGIICAFVAREINGMTLTKVEKLDAAGNVIKNAEGAVELVQKVTGSAGAISILTLISAIVFMLIISYVCKRFKLDKLEPFAMPIAMFGAMGMAILFTNVLPEDIAGFYWYEIGEILK